MKDLMSSLFPEKGRRVAIFGSLMQEEEGIGVVWSWASVNGDGGGKDWYWSEGGRGLRDWCRRWKVLIGLHESHILCQVDDLLSDISYIRH